MLSESHKSLLVADLIPSITQFFPRNKLSHIDNYQILMRALEVYLKDETKLCKPVLEALAAKNYPPAIYALSFFYRYGIGPDFIESIMIAHKLCWQAAKMGFIPACYERAHDLYQLSFRAKGEQVRLKKKRLYLAKEYLEKAAASGHVQAMIDLGNHYGMGTDLCDQDMRLSLMYFAKASDAGNDFGAYKYAQTCENLYDSNHGIQEYLIKARDLYQNLAKKRNQLAISGLVRVQKKLAQITDSPSFLTSFPRLRHQQAQKATTRLTDGLEHKTSPRSSTLPDESQLKLFRHAKNQTLKESNLRRKKQLAKKKQGSSIVLLPPIQEKPEI